ncbi:hypothetical protein Ae201684P_006754 [Aphanomyces euteiches]|uniref:Neurotransmitter-gated ion-channel ligand-binding domain-containing protein n=1 Tax=Aphanomyces euteiches TaxID=100861 RepID=A0A6G0X8U0_9STRA|nr:hypothetical protein Ae201684_007466 [Aphanomyces euteiches]KAH9100557.1 hypothetical protein Ae201684P_006754 [Aphanomyces euteiches]
MARVGAASLNTRDLYRNKVDKRSLWNDSVLAFCFQEEGLVVGVEGDLPHEVLEKSSKLLALYGGPCGVWEITYIDYERNVFFCRVDQSAVRSDDSAPSYPWELHPARDDSDNWHLQPASQREDNVRCELLPPMIAHCRTTILSLFGIDTVGQKFQGDVLFDICFQDIATIHAKHEWVEELAKIIHIGPETFECLNAVSIDGDVRFKTSCERSKRHPDSHLNYCIEMRFKGCFAEEFELKDFPFDQQQLTLYLASNQPVSHVVLNCNDSHPSRFLAHNFTLGNVFDIVTAEHVLSYVALSDATESMSGSVYNSIDFFIYLERKPGFYVSNVMAPISILTYLGFLSFGIESSGARMATSSRLSISVTLLLTTVAFKFATAGALPQISYLTSLDRFVTYTSLFMSLISIENAVFPWWCTDASCFDDEMTVLWTLMAIFTAGICISGVVVLRKLRDRKKANALLLKQHELRRLVAKTYPNNNFKRHAEIFTKLLVKMNLPPMPPLLKKRHVKPKGEDPNAPDCLTREATKSMDEIERIPSHDTAGEDYSQIGIRRQFSFPAVDMDAQMREAEVTQDVDSPRLILHNHTISDSQTSIRKLSSIHPLEMDVQRRDSDNPVDIERVLNLRHECISQLADMATYVDDDRLTVKLLVSDVSSRTT